MTTPSQDQDQPARARVGRPRFSSPPAPDPILDQLDATDATSPSESPNLDTRVDDGAPAPDAEPTPSPKGKSRRGSSRASSPGDAETLRHGIAAAVSGASVVVHEVLARDDYDKVAGVWLADPQDVDGIADPAASIMSRRTGNLGAGNPDVADGISLAIALVFWLVKQMHKIRFARSMRRSGAAVDGFQPEVAPPTPPTNVPSAYDTAPPA